MRVPYRGIDEWTRLAIGAGGTLLAVLAALLAFWPRRGRTGFPAAALLALVTLYAVPAVVLNFEGEFLRGALLALLMLAFLRLEKLRVRDAPAAGAVAAAAAIGALIAAPALDGRDPWFDYESWAVETASAKAVTFSWDHDYSPLDWPRDGRELLRVKAEQAGVLEGARAVAVRRAQLAPGSAPARRGPVGPAALELQQPGALEAGDRGHACATCARTASSRPGSRRPSTASPAIRSAAACSSRRTG